MLIYSLWSLWNAICTAFQTHGTLWLQERYLKVGCLSQLSVTWERDGVILHWDTGIPRMTSADSGNPHAECEQSEKGVHHSYRSSLAVGLACLVFTVAGRTFVFKTKTFAYVQPSKQFELEICECFLHTRSFRGARSESGGWCWCKGVTLQLEILNRGNSFIMDCKGGCPDFALCCSANKSAPCPICLGCSLYKNPWTDSPEQRTPVLLLIRCAPMRPQRMVC